MERFLSIISILCCAVTLAAETVFVFDSQESMTQKADGFTVAMAAGSGTTAPAYKDFNGPEVRLYTGNTITLTGPDMTNVQLVWAKSYASNKEYAGLNADCGTLVSGGKAETPEDWKVDTWTGQAQKIVFTLDGKGQRQIQKIVINGEKLVIDNPGPGPLPTVEDLDKEYIYPASVTVKPDITDKLYKEEYAFIDNNILVRCTQGSLIPATDTTLAYFNCNAGYEITFTAVQDIKTLAVDGFVRKAFSADCQPGDIWFETDEDFDIEAFPVLTVTGINATSVTISCPKQIRCYEVRIAFTDTEAVENHTDGQAQWDTSAPLYDVLGRTVNSDYKGVVIRNGHTFIRL